MRSPQRGLAFLALLIAIALIGAVLAATSTVWSQAAKRERERQLLWVGDQYRRALQKYTQYGDGTYPRQLEHLLEDPRSAAPRRFLRRLYEDPMSGQADWVLVRDARGGIRGVRSRVDGVPLKTGRFPAGYAAFEKATSYTDWVFVAGANPPLQRASGPGSGASAGTPGPPGPPGILSPGPVSPGPVSPGPLSPGPVSPAPVAPAPGTLQPLPPPRSTPPSEPAPVAADPDPTPAPDAEE